MKNFTKWVVSLFLLIFTLAMLGSGQIISSISFLIALLVALPPVAASLKQRVFNSVSNSSYSSLKYLAVILFSVIGLFASSWGEENKETPEATSAISEKDSVQATNDVEVPQEETVKWLFFDDIDKMTSKKVKYATVFANNELDFDFPYNGGSIAKLTIRKKDGRNDVMLSVSKGQFNTSYEGNALRIKFDEKQPKRYSFSQPSDGSYDLIFINSTSDVISRLKKSKSIIIEVEFHREGLRQIEFDTNGFEW